MKNRSFIILAFFLCLINKSKSQSGGIEILLDSAYSCRLHADYEGNLQYLRKAEKIITTQTDPLLVSKVYSELSKQNLITNADYDQSKAYAEKSLSAGRQSKNKLAIAYGYYSLANWYNYLDIRDVAVANAQKALKILRDTPDQDLASRIYYIMYGVYANWNDLPQSSKYADLAVLTALEARQFEILSNAYTAKSVVMGYQYNKTKDIIYLDSIRMYLHKAVDLFEAHPDKVGIRTYAIANLNLANFFFQHPNENNSIDQDSIRYFSNIAANAAREFDHNYEILGNVKGLHSELAILQNDLPAAEAYLMDAYTQLKQAPLPSYYTLFNVSAGLTKLYEKENKFKSALFYQKQQQIFNDSIFNQNAIQQVKKLEAQYENKKLTEDLKTLDLEASNKKRQNLLLWGICLLLGCSLFLLLLYFKAKTRLHRQNTWRLENEQEEERKRIALKLQVEQAAKVQLETKQQLLTLQKEQLEKEAMADALQIERKNNLLLELKEKLKKLETDGNRGTVDRLIREEMQIEEALQQSVKEFKHIHPDFFQKLKEKSGNRLTSLELKHCAYLLLGLSTKEMASIFHVDPKSIRVSKYRIKQKLQLGKQTDLDGFIQELK